MKYVVTGGFGYLGSRLLEAIISAHKQVCVFDNLMYNQYGAVVSQLAKYEITHGEGKTSFSSIETQKLDIFSEQSCDTIVDKVREYSQYDDCTVYLLHALVGMPICNRYDETMGKEFVETVNFKTVDMLAKKLNTLPKPPLIVYPNTNSGYGNTQEVCTEETPLNPISSYGETKLRAEESIKKHCAKWVVFRLATLFGLSQRMRFDLMVNDWVHRAYFEKELNIFEPDTMRNFVHVDDVADIMWLMSLSPTEQLHLQCNVPLNNVYNLGNDEINCSKIDLAKKISNHTQTKINVVLGSDPDQRNYIVSSAKLRKCLAPCYQKLIGLDKGISEILQFLKTLPQNPDLRKDLEESLGFRNVIENNDLRNDHR